jgi:hypothetical protein
MPPNRLLCPRAKSAASASVERFAIALPPYSGSSPGLTRRSIPLRNGWTRGSSPRVTKESDAALSENALAGAPAGQRVWIFLPLAAVAPHGRLGCRSQIQVLDFPRPWPFWRCFRRPELLARISLWRHIVPRLPAKRRSRLIGTGSVYRGSADRQAPVTLAIDFKALISSVTAALAGGVIADYPRTVW